MKYILPKPELHALLDRWSAAYAVFAPQKTGAYAEYLPYGVQAELCLEEPHNTRYPAKALFFPQSEAILKYNRKFNQLESAAAESQKRVIFGIRPCDAKAVTLLDTVFAEGDNQDPFWLARRAETLLIGLGCHEPCATCFCTSAESGPFHTDGLDALLTDLGGEYLVELQSERAAGLFDGLTPASATQQENAQGLQQAAEQALPKAFELEGMKEKLDRVFDQELWAQLAQSCLGCGICTFLCPTCFCFDLVDEAQRDTRVRNWDSCMFRVYSLEASAHNPRPTRKERTRQRLMHKYSYWWEHADKLGCTGCGRCVRYCPVGLDIRAMIRKAGAYENEVLHAN
ncbi:MAG: 4Fe-4S dicluster domain-containing protein [Anaerolineaceae bacterium]